MRQLLCVLALMVFFTGWGQKTTRGKLRLREEIRVEHQESAIDTIRPAKGEIVVSGYEKSQQSTTECFFVTNHTSHTITGITFTISYYNMRGEQLHSRTETVRCDIPPSETRKLDIRAWDRQKLWYYKHSQGRHNDNSTPFDVAFHIHYCLTPKE